MNKLFFILIIIFCCSACINEDILPAKNKLTSQTNSKKNKASSEKDDDKKDNDDDDDDKAKEKEKDQDKDKEKDKKDDDDDQKDKDKEKKDKEDKKKDKDKKNDDDKEDKKDDKDKYKSGKSFLLDCDESKSFNDADVNRFFKDKVWTAMLKSNTGQFEAYRLATTHNTITTSFASFSDCRTETNSYTAEVISHTLTGRTVNTGNPDDSFIIGCMNNSYMEAIYSNGEILHFYNEDQLMTNNIDRCNLKFTVLN